jgi:hypothetical protein
MKIRNWTLLITLSALACFFYFYITPVYLHPAEDAAILFNYAQNLKETGVISYYPGGPAVDGSTDFLFLALTSLAMHVFPDAYQAALLVSSMATMLLMFLIFRLLDTRTLTLQYMALALIFFSQQIWAAVLGYGTFLFAMTIAWAVLAYWRGKFRALALASFIAVLARPDALITVLPLMAHKFYAEKGDTGKKSLAFLFLFVLPTLAYGFFRYWYFGDVLPLSFHISTTGEEKVWGIFLQKSIYHVQGYAIYYIWPAIIGLGIFILKQKFRLEPGYYVLIISMIVLPMIAYMGIRENLDFSRRYFIIPYLGFVLVITLLIRNHKSIILTIFGILLLLKVGYTSFNQGVSNLSLYYNNMHSIGEKLGELPSGVLATSEAGILPWKTRFTSIDLWGLNTKELTGRLPEAADFEAWKADVIVIHGNTEDYALKEVSAIGDEKSWLNMLQTTCRSAHDMEYLFYLVPFDWRNYKTATLDSRGLLRTFFQWLSEQQKRQPSSRMDLMAVHPNSTHKADIIKIIEEHGGQAFVLPNQD